MPNDTADDATLGVNEEEHHTPHTISKSHTHHKQQKQQKHRHLFINISFKKTKKLLHTLKKKVEKCRVVLENQKRRRTTPQMMRHWA